MILAAAPAHAAYKILGIPGASVATDLPAHVLVSGAGSELADGFLKSAASRAYYLKAQNPERAVIVITPIEALTNLEKDAQARLVAKGVKEGDREARWIPDTGLQVLEESAGILDTTAVIGIAKRYEKIQSFEIFSHASWPSGAALQGGALATRFPFTKAILNIYDGGPIDPTLMHPALPELAARMAPDAFAVIWGCNSAYTIAPMLSAVLRVPVLGSLTFTDFETLHKDGNYYKEEAKLPASPAYGANPWARADNISYAKPLDCEKGCRRMKPNNVPYAGVWGNFDRVKAGLDQPPALPPPGVTVDPANPLPLPPKVERPAFNGGGLNFYKAFCNYDEKIEGGKGPFADKARSVSAPGPRCLRGMGAFMMSALAPVAARDTSFSAYKRRLLDFLCPHESGHEEFLTCVRALERMEGTRERVFSSYHGNVLNCDFHNCHGRFDYLAGDAYGIDQASVRLDAPENTRPTAQADEYFHYLEAYTAFTKQAVKKLRLAPKLEETFADETAKNAKTLGRLPASPSARR